MKIKQPGTQSSMNGRESKITKSESNMQTNRHRPNKPRWMHISLINKVVATVIKDVGMYV